MRRPRLKWSLGLAVVALMVLLLSWLWSAWGDPKDELAALRRMGYPTSFAEMKARLPIFPPGENAGPALQAAVEQMSNHRFDDAVFKVIDQVIYRDPAGPWSEAERIAAEAVTATNATAFVILHELLQRPRILLVTNLVPGEMPDVPRPIAFIDAARLFALRSGCAARGQRSAEAAESIGDSLALARCLGTKPGLVNAIVHSGVSDITFSSLEGALHHTRFTDTELKGLQAVLDRGWVTDLTEWAIVADFCSMRAHSETSGSFLPNIVFGTGPMGNNRVFDILYAQFFAAVGLQRQDFTFCARRLVRYLEIVRSEPAQRARLLTTAQEETQRWIKDHYWRTRFSAVAMASFFSVVESDLHSQLRNRAAKAALAVERYRLTHADALPSALAALVPEFLDRVPQDLYTAAPLRYRPLERGYVIYSLGSDLQDDGGNGTNHVDITFRVER